MRDRTIVQLKVLVWLACLYPLIRTIVQTLTGGLGPDPTRTITFTTGSATLWILILSLAVTPIRKLVPKLSWLIRFRRLLGLFAFFYATLHLLTYLGLYAYFDFGTIAADLMKRRYVLVGMSAWVLLSLLAMTSTAWSIRKLGGARWRALHRLVYLAAVLGILHFWWLVKPGVLSPLGLTILLAALLLLRPILALRQSDLWEKARLQPGRKNAI
jgi:sulfoxide reductase heme-binding subunit YedZ